LIMFSPEGERIAANYGSTLKILDSKTGAVVLQPLRAPGNTINMSSKMLANAETTAQSLFYQRVVPSDPHMPISGTKKLPDSATAIGFSQDLEYIVYGSHDNTVRVCSFNSCAQIAGPLHGHKDRVTSVAFSPDGKQIVSGSSDHTVRVWDRDTGATAAEPLDVHSNGISAVAFLPDGKLIVSGSNDGTIRLWNPTNATPVSVLEGHTGPIISFAFSYDRMRFLSWSMDKSVRVWDAQHGAKLLGPLQTSPLQRGILLQTSPQRGIFGFKFSLDDKHVVSWNQDETMPVQIWDSETGAVVGNQPFEGHTEIITSFAFSPDGKQIVTSSLDKTVRVWYSDTGDLAAGPFVENGVVTSVSFSQDGTYVISACARDYIAIRAWKVWHDKIHCSSLILDRFRILIHGDLILVLTTGGSSILPESESYGSLLGCVRVYVFRGAYLSSLGGDPRHWTLLTLSTAPSGISALLPKSRIENSYSLNTFR
jgi:WD40 repeat protein